MLNTCLIENKYTIFAPAKGNDLVAQLVEQYTFNVWALGSNPSGITKSHSLEWLFC